MDALVERNGSRWDVVILDDDGYRRPEETETYPTETQADDRAAEINGDDDEE